MGSKTVSEGMAGASFVDSGTLDGGGDFAGDGAFVEMVATFGAGARVDGEDRGRKNVLPFPFFACLREFSIEGGRHIDFAEAAFEIFLMEEANFFQMFEKVGF